MSEIHPSYASGKKLPLVKFTRIDRTIYVSGHGAVDGTGRYICDDFEGQMRYTMDNLKATLEEAGVTYEQVRQVRGYVQFDADLPAYNRIYAEYFTGPLPARTTITNCLPKGLLFEIECIAEALPQATDSGAASNG